MYTKQTQAEDVGDAAIMAEAEDVALEEDAVEVEVVAEAVAAEDEGNLCLEHG